MTQENRAEQNFLSFKNKQFGYFVFIILTLINESRKCIPSEWMMSVLIINIYNINASHYSSELMKYQTHRP